MVLRAGFHGTVGQSSAQVINGSLKFDKDKLTYLTRTPGSSGNRNNWTISCWIKRGKIGVANQRMFESGSTAIRFGSDVFQWIDGSSGNNGENTPAAKIRDPGWYHLVFAWDSSAGVLGNRIYVNGVELQYVQTGGGNPSGNSAWNTGSQVHTIGRNAGNTGRYYDGMMSQCYFVDGQTLGPVGFGFTDPLTNTWRPKKYTGTFGTNGFWLPMDNQDDFEKDKSGNGNHWTKNNFSGTFNNPDVLKDSPSGVVFGGPPTTGITTTSSTAANYATLNLLDSRGLSNGPTFSEGNLRIGSSSSYDITSTIGADSGKWYWEVEMIDVGTTICGIIDLHNSRSSQFSMTSPTVYYATTRMNGTREGNQSGGTNFTYTDGDIVAWALDVDNLKLYGYKNGSLQSTATITQTDITWSPYVYGESTTDHRFNFGQKPFRYAPPQGFLPLNSASVRPETVIPRPDQYVGVTTYVGITQSPRTISLPITPDLIWVKNRSDDGTGHYVLDTVRGDNNNIRPDGDFTQAAVNGASHGIISTIGFNSFTVKDGGGSGNNVGSTGTDDYVAWMWKAGGNKNTFNVDDVGYATAAAAGFGGSATITGASVGTKQGFGIIKYTGTGGNTTVGHNLGKSPSFIVIKCLDTERGDAWRVWHSSLAANERLVLSDTKTKGSATTLWQNTLPTSTVFYLDDDNRYNSANDDHIAYLWCDIPGLQKFGSYEGGSNPYVELGFRPALVLFKNIDSTSNWDFMDTERDPFNVMTKSIQPNLSNDEYPSEPGVDYLSNGFKLRGSFNTSHTYIYAAWAEAPVSNLYGGQSNAR